MNATRLPKLDAPGAGLPLIEWAVAKFIIVPSYLRRTTPQQALARMREQAESILSIARSLSPENLSKRVLIPRLRGLEDSSRYYSVAMTVQHLVIVNKRTMQLIESLSQGKVPNGTASTAAVKPTSDVDADLVLNEYDELLKTMLKTLEKLDFNNLPEAKYAHPWFGPLTAREWLLFIPMHQGVHQAQIREITNRL